MIQHISQGSLAILLMILVCLAPAAQAQEESRFEIAAVDISEFPVVHITLITADSRGAPADLTNLTVQENGTPVAEFTFDHVPQGIDATFILDANTGFEEIDDETGFSRREKVRDSIIRFAVEFMNPEGLDRISILVPDEDGQGGQFLIQNEGDPQKIIAAINSYEPARLGPTPLNAILNLAIEQTLQNEAGSRYQTILLFSDARRLDEQLSYPLLVAQANDAKIPIYGAILGQSADEIELANMARLTEATHAFHLHMPQAEAADPIFQIWQQQGNPVRVSYNSRERQSGRSQITLNLNNVQAGTDFEVIFAPPNIKLSLTNTEIQRIGTAQDTPLGALQPQVQPVTVTISWPDGLPRKLIEIILLTNNRPQRIPDELLSNPDGSYELPWDISQLDTGTVELFVQVLDELGYQGRSTTQTVNVQVERPLPPTAAPTPVPQELPPEAVPSFGSHRQSVLIIAAVFLFVAAVVFWIWRRSSKKKKSVSASYGILVQDGDPDSSDIVPVTAVLEPISPSSGIEIILHGSNITIGNDPNSVQIILTDESIGRLHARIRRHEQAYWLFDEGSAAGVTLNYEKLGLAPQELQDGDVVQFGKLTFRFVLRASLEI